MSRMHHPSPQWRDLPLEVERTESRTVVRVGGEIDASTAPVLRRCLRGLLDGGASEVEVDLHEVPFCDDTGLGILVGAHRRLDQDGGHLVVREPAPGVRRTLVEHGLDRVLHIS